MTEKFSPEPQEQEIFEAMERQGLIHKTGDYREGRPVFALTKKGVEFGKYLWAKEMQAETEQMQEANPIPDDYDGRRLYILEMLAEIAEHHDIPIAPTEIEQHVVLELERLPDGTWDDGWASLTEAGAALVDAYYEEDRQKRQAEAEGRELVTRAWSRKLTSRQ